MFLKCGQKDNKNYTFGIKREDRIFKNGENLEESEIDLNNFCPKCGQLMGKKGYCVFCEEK